MDLISRKAARTAVYGYEMQTGIAEMPLEFAHNKIDEVPSVPAVPLDKLCEWLEDNASLPYGTSLSRHAWRQMITSDLKEEHK